MTIAIGDNDRWRHWNWLVLLIIIDVTLLMTDEPLMTTRWRDSVDENDQ